MTFVKTTKSIICCCRPGNQPAYKQSQEEDHNDNKSDITGRSVCAGLEDDDLELAPFEKDPNLDESREDEVHEVTSPSSVSFDERVLPAGEENQKVAVVAAAVRPTDGISENEVVNADGTNIVDLSKEVPANTANPMTNPLKPSGSGEKSTREVKNETNDGEADNTIREIGDIEKVHVSTSIEALEVEEDAKELLELKVSKSVELSVNPSDECKTASRSTIRIEEDSIVSALSEVEVIAASSNASNESDELLADTSKKVEVEAIAVSRSYSSKLEDPFVSAPDEVEVEPNFVLAIKSNSSASETQLTNDSNEVEVEVEVMDVQCKSEDSLASALNEAEVDIRSASRSASNVSEVKVMGTSRSTSSKSESNSSASETQLTNASNEVEVEVMDVQCKSEDSSASALNEAEVDIRSASRSASNVSEVKVMGTSRSTSSKSEDFLVKTSKIVEAVGTSNSSLVEEEAISSEGILMLGLATSSHEGEDKKDDFEITNNVIASEAMQERKFDYFEEAEKSAQIESNSSQQNLTNISLQSDDETKEKDDGLSQNKI